MRGVAGPMRRGVGVGVGVALECERGEHTVEALPGEGSRRLLGSPMQEQLRSKYYCVCFRRVFFFCFLFCLFFQGVLVNRINSVSRVFWTYSIIF